MKPFALVALALVVAAGAQTPARLYGKTKAQALAMGEDKWMKFVDKQPGGGSTQGMVQGMDFYAEAAHARNQRLRSKLPRKRQLVLSKAYEAMKQAGSSLLVVEREAAGGGTIYQTFGASRRVNIETLFYRILTHRNKEAMVSGNLMREARDNWEDTVKKTNEPTDKAEFQKAVEKAREDLDAAIDAVRSLGENDQMACRQLIVEWLTPEST